MLFVPNNGSPAAQQKAAMGRHFRDYQGERFSAHLGLWLTPSDRAAMEQGAAALEMKLSDYARMLIVNGLRAQKAATPRRAAQQAAMDAAIDRLTELGRMLNTLAHDANINQRIRKPRLAAQVGEALIEELKKVPRPSRSRAMNKRMRELVAELRAIGNNVDQLRRLAKGKLAMAIVGLMDRVETALAELVNAALP